MMRLMLIACAVVALLGGGTLWWQSSTIDGLRAALERTEASVLTLEQANGAQNATLAALRRDVATRDAVIADRDRRMARIETERAAARRTLTEALNDPTTRQWAAAPLPDAVRGLLR